MHIPQSLQTIAEVSIAFAGFSGLIVALRKNIGPLTKIEKYRLQVLLALAFGALFLSFLPEVLDNLELEARYISAYSGLAVCLYSGVFLAWWIRASRNYARAFPEIFQWRVFSRMAAGHAAIIFLQLAAVFSLIPNKGATAYVIALIWYLIHAAQQFIRMLFVTPNDNEQGAE